MNRREFLAALGGLAIAPWSGGPAASAMGLHIFGTPPAPDQVRRVFAAGAPAAVLVYALAPGKLLGWPMQLGAEARALLAPACRDLPYLGRLAGRGSTMPLEKLLALKPDVIIDAGTVDETYLSAAERAYRQTGIPYVLIDGRLTDSARQLRETGRLLGVAERGERLAAYAGTALKVADGNPGEGRPRVYLARGADGLETGLAGAINAEVIAIARGVNVAAAARRGGLARVSLERLLSWMPEIIVTQDAAFYRRARTDSTWMRLPAVREKRFYLVPSVPFGWLDVPPGINRLIGVRWLADRLRGGAGGKSWIAEAANFHHLFYGHAPSQEVLARLLEHA